MPKSKSEMMRRLRLQRKARGLLTVNVLAYRPDWPAIRAFGAKLRKMREADHAKDHE